MPRTVLFIDPPAFCTTVERIVAPDLRRRPVAVAPPGAHRAVVLALSADAATAGIRRGMPVRQAQRICPDLVVVPPNPQLYARATRALLELLGRWAPVIEPRGWGHAYLDLTGTGRLFGPPMDVAVRIAREVQARLRLPLVVGIAGNKLVSTVAVHRAGEPAIWVPEGTEAPFLAPRSVTLLPELPPRMRTQLDDYQLERIGEVAAIPEATLCSVFGGAGRRLRAHAQGIDPRPVLPPEQRAEFRAAHTLATDTNDRAILDALLRRLTERVGLALRRRGLGAERLVVSLAYADYAIDRATVTIAPAALDAELCSAGRRALGRALRRRTAVRELTVVADRLVEKDVQLELWDPAAPPHPTAAPTLQQATDRIRMRWGARSLRVAAGC